MFQGDGGNPLVIDNGITYTQIGILSFLSNRGCNSGYPTGYTRVTYFLEWIRSNIGP